ncbi:MAG: OmpH family outer membrane protein [Syntrophaceae bacterium]|nr:OmpH family outer membrane protein [Syntrophaceae bacterium]
MKRWLVLFLLCIPWVFVSVVMSAQAAPVRIGIIDTQKIIKDSRAAKEARAVFQKEQVKRQAAYAAREKEVVKLQEELRNLDANAPVELRKTKTDKFNIEAKELKRFKDDLEEELRRREIELTTKVIQDLNRVLEEYRKKEKLAVIIYKSSAATYDEALDITDRIIKIYDGETGKKK